MTTNNEKGGSRRIKVQPWALDRLREGVRLGRTTDSKTKGQA